MNKIIYIILSLFLLQACSKECCFDGDPITENEALEILNQNESTDSISFGKIEGRLECLNGTFLSGLTIQIKDSKQITIDQISGNINGFNFPILETGTYTLIFKNSNLPTYTTEQYETIIERLDEIILGASPATNIEKLAYNIVGFDNGLTTLDRITFTNLKNGTTNIEDLEFPWRYVISSQINASTSITDSIMINIDKTQKLNLDITPIYIGDTNGEQCN